MKLPYRSHNDIIEWALTILPFNIQNDVEIVVETPWSSVFKITSPLSQEVVYLKQTPPGLWIESEILNKCRHLCGVVSVPDLIAENKDLHCFLMNQCGDLSLRTLFNGSLNADIMGKGLSVYREIQQSTAQYVDEFIAIGVPDWRLDKLPDLYRELVNDEAFLISEGLVESQITELQNMAGAYQDICMEIADYGVPECLNHGDFHDNNMLLSHDTGQVSIIDLGETTIDHPFFSLASCLTRTAWRYNLTPDSADYQMLRRCCFQGWLASDRDLQKLLKLVDKMLPCYAVFSHIRLLNAAGPMLNDMPRMKHRIKEGLEKFIEVMQSA